MNPADKRLSELLDKWLTSLQLHLKYSQLDDSDYRQVQPWPTHDRPSRWIIEMALQKVRLLQEQLNTRVEMGDAKFSDALELMGFLTNLVGSQHIRRFIPLAEPQSETTPISGSDQTTTITPAATALAPIELNDRSGTRTNKLRADPSQTGTREMPRPKLPIAKPLARRESKPSNTVRTRSPTKPTTEKKPANRDQMVLADAKRLLGWGRKWHELPELISSMADRPSLTEVRRVLRENKAALE